MKRIPKALPGLALLLVVGALSPLTTACLDVASERVERDRRVGFAVAEGVAVEVAEGHAAVRLVSPDRVELWQSTPGIRLRIAVDDPGPMTLFVKNTMPASKLVQLSGQAQRIEELGREVPTRAEFELHFQEATEVELQLSVPDADTVRPFRIALMSDVQEAIDRVSDLYARMNQEPSVEFLLGAGDLTQQGERAQLARFEQELLALDVPYYTTLGNHELGESPPPYHDTFGRGSFSFSYHGARFTMLDSASATIDPTVYEWLDEWLGQGRDVFHAVAMHVPPIDPVGLRNGSFASRNEANKLLGRLRRGGVDLTLYGHLHSYFRFTNAGIPARVSGGGGSIPERFDQIGRHFLTIDIDPAAQTFETRVVQIDGD